MVQHSSVRYNCTMCNYSALNRQCLRNHMRVQHSNEKPFQCVECGKSFKLKNTLLNHMVQHTGVRKFVCPFCNRKFASSGNFYSHRKRMHPQELAAMKLKMEEDERYASTNCIYPNISCCTLCFVSFTLVSACYVNNLKKWWNRNQYIRIGASMQYETLLQ